MSDSYDDYELKIQLAEHAWEEHVDEIVNTEHNKQIEIAQAYERGWNAALAQREWVPEALRLADALDELDRQFSRNGLCGDAAAELRRLHEALETEQEPVAWISEGGDVSRSKRYMDEMGFKCNPLYTAPPKREWVGLTDEERHGIREWQRIQEELGPVWAPMMLYLYEAIEAKLKERNT
jgi:hypothetical protein